MADVLERAKALTVNATRGPWQWFGNTKQQDVYLATTHSGRIFVLGFSRWGMRGAQPLFQVHFGDGGGFVADLKTLEERWPEHAVRYEVPYRRDFVGISHPDATFIAESRQLVDDLVAEVERLRAELQRAAPPPARDVDTGAMTEVTKP